MCVYIYFYFNKHGTVFLEYNSRRKAFVFHILMYSCTLFGLEILERKEKELKIEHMFG